MTIFQRFEKLAQAFGLELAPFEAGLSARLKWYASVPISIQLLVHEEQSVIFRSAKKIEHDLQPHELNLVALHLAINFGMTNKRPNMEVRGTNPNLPDFKTATKESSWVGSYEPPKKRGLSKRTQAVFNDHRREIEAMRQAGRSLSKISQRIKDVTDIRISKATLSRHLNGAK